jgi:hypothetical protein
MFIQWFASEPGSEHSEGGQPGRDEAAASDERKPTAAREADGPPGEEEDEQEDEPVNAMLADLLPWAISILFHAGLVLLTTFLIWAGQGEEEKDKKIIPSTQLGETPEAQLETSETQTETTSQSTSQAESSSSSSNLQSTVDTSSAIIGANAASGETSPFGSGVGDGEGGDFMGSSFGGNVTRMVFLIDASGSLIDSLPFVIEELKSTVQQLSPKQKFTIIFFRGAQYFDQPIVEVPVPETGLKQATSKTKAAVNEWITLSNGNIVPGGEAPPMKAIRRALQYRPQLVIILSDDITGTGIHQIDQTKLLKEIKQINKSNTKFNTIQFLYPDPLAKVPGKQGTLKMIAEQTGGKYKFVDEDEINR